MLIVFVLFFRFGVCCLCLIFCLRMFLVWCLLRCLDVFLVCRVLVIFLCIICVVMLILGS